MIEQVVYTAVFGEYDAAKVKPAGWPGRFVCFTDHEVKLAGWENVVVERQHDDPRCESKRYKALPHRWFPGAVSLWIDGNAELLKPPGELFALLDGADVALCKHPFSKTLADEARLVIKLNKAPRDQVERQMAQYARPDLPVGACGWILRRDTDCVRKFNELWWEEMQHHTLRDQLSAPYCLDKADLEVRFLDLNIYKNKWIRLHRNLLRRGT